MNSQFGLTSVSGKQTINGGGAMLGAQMTGQVHPKLAALALPPVKVDMKLGFQARLNEPVDCRRSRWQTHLHTPRRLG